MNLFWKKLTGRIKPTDQIEKEENELAEASYRFYQVENSPELAAYKSLYHEVKSPAFIENKKILQTRKYKNTEEYKTVTSFENLQNSPSLRLYYKVLGSVELKEFEYFKLSPEFELLKDEKKVNQSERLQKLKNFQDSESYKTYLQYHNSNIIKEYLRLKEIVTNPEFKKLNDFWSNENRWQTTLDFEKEQQFNELENNPDIEFYISENPKKIEQYKLKKITFSDDFDWDNLEKSSWNYGFHYSNSKLIGNHSFANEKQGNNSGKNLSFEGNSMKIITKSEKLVTNAWDPFKGFIQKQFYFTSDVVNSANSFKQKEGIFSAKLRCEGNIHHAFWLGGKGMLPHINIFHFDGKRIKVGNITENIVDGVEIKGINPSNYFIYTLIWNKSELIWKINNIEVFRTTSYIPDEEMYIVFNSFIPEKMPGGTGLFEIDWVRVYQN